MDIIIELINELVPGLDQCLLLRLIYDDCTAILKMEMYPPLFFAWKRELAGLWSSR